MLRRRAVVSRAARPGFSKNGVNREAVDYSVKRGAAADPAPFTAAVCG